MTPTFLQPTNYIRASKRIDDENDLLVDYIAENEDLVSHCFRLFPFPIF